MRSASPVTTGRTPVLAVKPGLEDERRLRALEVGQFAFQLLVKGERAGDGAHGTGADTELPHGTFGSRPQARVMGQAQVVVRGEADDLAAIDRADRTLGRGQLAQGPVEVAGAQLGQLVGQEGQRVGAGAAHPRLAGASCVGHQRLQSMMTLPESPDRATEKAASWSRKAKRCVMAGRMSRPDCSMTLILYQVSYISRP